MRPLVQQGRVRPYEHMRQTKTFGEERICSGPNCQTVLSRYNQTELCRSCSPPNRSLLRVAGAEGYVDACHLLGEDPDPRQIACPQAEHRFKYRKERERGECVCGWRSLKGSTRAEARLEYQEHLL
jgi:hypothetical protein